jgi:hypothetical protein
MHNLSMPHVSVIVITAHNVTYYTVLIFMDPCIVDDSVEIPTRCSFVIEFIIPKFIEGSTCFERNTARHQEL